MNRPYVKEYDENGVHVNRVAFYPGRTTIKGENGKPIVVPNRAERRALSSKKHQHFGKVPQRVPLKGDDGYFLTNSNGDIRFKTIWHDKAALRAARTK